jgi:anti-sigma28 factor (negative regulator of flagellin synthesis)
MEISALNNILSVYKAAGTKPSGKTGEVGKPVNTDRLSLNLTNWDKAIEMKKQDISQSVKNYNEDTQIEKIRAQIENGTYNVPAEDVARALLGY